MKGFRVEQSDVLLSVQMILTREEEAGRRLLARGTQQRPQQAVRAPSAPSRPVPIRRPAHPPAPATVRNGSRQTGPPIMVDALTGVGTIHALRRDLMLGQAWPVAGQPTPVLVAVEIGALDQIRTDMGAAAGDYVLKSLVEVSPFALGTQDRIYRSGRNQLTLLLPGTDSAGAETARSALETARSALEAALHRRLAGRGYPEVRLAAMKLDAVALAS